MHSQIKNPTELIYHLTLDDEHKDNCAFCNSDLSNYIGQQAIPKHSALIVEPVASSSAHACIPSASTVNHFSSIAYITPSDDNAFAEHFSCIAAIKIAIENAAIFMNYEDAYSWSVAKLAKAQ